MATRALGDPSCSSIDLNRFASARGKQGPVRQVRGKSVIPDLLALTTERLEGRFDPAISGIWAELHWPRFPLLPAGTRHKAPRGPKWGRELALSVQFTK